MLVICVTYRSSFGIRSLCYPSLQLLRPGVLRPFAPVFVSGGSVTFRSSCCVWGLEGDVSSEVVGPAGIWSGLNRINSACYRPRDQLHTQAPPRLYTLRMMKMITPICLSRVINSQMIDTLWMLVAFCQRDVIFWLVLLPLHIFFLLLYRVRVRNEKNPMMFATSKSVV